MKPYHFNGRSLISDQLKQSSQLKLSIAETSVDIILEAAKLMVNTIKEGGKILLCGNGGSAADAQHISAELVGAFQMNRKPLPAIALTTDTSILTSVGNDYGFEDIFTRQVRALGRPGDLLLGISTSGSSKNVLKALGVAKELGILTMALIGSPKSPMDNVADVVIHIQSTNTARIQEMHITIGHILCDYIERSFFQRDDGGDESK